MSYIKKYFKKEVLIIGYGLTGKSISKFLEKQKCNIHVWDDNFDNLNLKIKDKIQIYNIENKNIDNFNYIFVSPGIQKEHFLLLKAKEKNITITSDIELYWEVKQSENIKNNLVAVTGTNGKSTIALMIAHIIETKPLGNYGNPILKALGEKKPQQVIELSSFQLDYINNFKSKISIISNIDKDHISHHKTFKQYLEAKMKIIKNQTKEDYLLINYDDKNIKKYLENRENINPIIIYVSNKVILKKGISVTKNKLIDNFFSNKEYLINDTSFLNLNHNKVNLAFSFAALTLSGKEPKHILNKLASFKGLAHRLEYLGVINNIKFFNDSKATNVSATCSALESFEKVILIAGGSSKGDSFEPLKKYSKVIYQAYLFGDTALEISDSLEPDCPSLICSDLDEAVKKSYRLSLLDGKYYPILFSPACASFDQYQNFEKRGEHFNSIFKRLLKEAA